MPDLDQTYKHLACSWTRDRLAAHYHRAQQSGAKPLPAGDQMLDRPIALLATAIPPVTTLNVAIHLLHALPTPAAGELGEPLLATADTNAASALHRCHRALELDGASHNYTTGDWLPVVYDIAAPLLESSSLEQEPPSILQQTQDAISWLSRAIAILDVDSPESPAALADSLARLLTACVFTDAARNRIGSTNE